MTIKTIIFDLDGTLIDTEPSAARAVQECFSEWKMTLDLTDAAYVTGRTWESAFQFLFTKYPVPISKPDAQQQIMRRYRKIIEENLTPVRGAVQAIESLATQYSLGLVSGSGRSEILWALKTLKVHHHFQVILGAEDYSQSKPDPEGYLKAVHALGSSLQSCLVFEDSTAGITSARAAGLWVIAVTSTNHFEQDLSRAHLKIHDLSEVNAAWIKTIALGNSID